MRKNRRAVGCAWCGVSMSRPPSKIAATNFCSEAHRGLWLGTQRGRATGGWRGGPAQKQCSQCGKTYSVPRHRASTSSCCSRRCNGLRGRAQVGSLAGNWRGFGQARLKEKDRLRDATRRAVAGTIDLPTWERIKARHGNKCLRCGAKRQLTVDHVVPLSRGGKHEENNVQPLCLPCNMWKHAKTIDYRGIVA